LATRATSTQSGGGLYGVRGEWGVDIQAIVEALLALSRLLIGRLEVTQIDINPVVTFPEEVGAVDARILAEPTRQLGTASLTTEQKVVLLETA
jgi:hypothetical protein